MPGSAPIVGRLRTAVLLTVIVLGVWGQASPASASGLYVAIGDSPSAGMGAPAGRGYVDLYYAYLREPANGGLDQLVNLSAIDTTTTTVREPGGQLARAVGAIAEPSDSVVVTVEIGEGDARSDDCSNGVYLITCPFVPNFTAILDELVAALAADPGDEVLQVMQYYNPASRSGTINEGFYAISLLGSDLRVDCSGSGDALGLNDWIACIGQSKGAIAVDTHATFVLGGQTLMSEWPNPNETGHAYIACLFEYPERAGNANPCEAPPAPPAVVRPPPIPDVTGPLLTVSGATRQSVLARRGVLIRLASGEDARLKITGKIVGRRHKRVARLRSIDYYVFAGESTQLRLGLSRKNLARVRRALRVRRRLTAEVNIEAKDEAGNITTLPRKITLVR